MKIRKSFVTNSSSSLFICNINMTDLEVEAELKRIFELYNEMMGRDYCYEQCIGYVDTYTLEAYNRDMEYIKSRSYGRYTWNGYGYETKENIGKIMIHGNDDNSIPYELHNIIEEKFDAYRYHLG